MLEVLTSKLISEATEIAWKVLAERLAVKRLASEADDLIRPTTEELDSTVEARLQKIREARTSLQEAASAVSELEHMARLNKAELAEALSQLGKAEAAKAAAAQELKSIREVAEADIDAFRRLAGVPTKLEAAKQRFAERAIGFAIGVLASVAASAVWWGLTKLVPLLK